jgi:hypothetical protein
VTTHQEVEEDMMITLVVVAVVVEEDLQTIGTMEEAAVHLRSIEEAETIVVTAKKEKNNSHRCMFTLFGYIALVVHVFGSKTFVNIIKKGRSNY